MEVDVMNKLLQKLHANKVNMRIIPFDVYKGDVIHIRFDRGTYHKSIEIDLRHLFKCKVSAEDIIMAEIDSFLNEGGFKVAEHPIGPEDLSVNWDAAKKYMKGKHEYESMQSKTGY